MAQKNFQEQTFQSLQSVRGCVQEITNEIMKLRNQTTDVTTKRFLSKAGVDLDSTKGYIEKAFALHEVELQQQEESQNGSQTQSYKPSRRMQEQNL